MLKKIGLFLFIFFLFTFKISAKTANVYLFYGQGCSYCSDAHNYLESIEGKYDVKIYSYEVWYNEDNKKLMEDVGRYLDFNISGVPFVVINNTPISGFVKNSTETTYNYHIELAQKEDFIDKVGIYLKVVDEDTINITTTKKVKIKTSTNVIETIILDFKNCINYSYIGLLLVLSAVLIVVITIIIIIRIT